MPLNKFNVSMNAQRRWDSSVAVGTALAFPFSLLCGVPPYDCTTGSCQHLGCFQVSAVEIVFPWTFLWKLLSTLQESLGHTLRSGISGRNFVSPRDSAARYWKVSQSGCAKLDPPPFFSPSLQLTTFWPYTVLVLSNFTYFCQFSTCLCLE